MLRFIPPAIPLLVETPPSGERWEHEIKYDGYRTQLHVEAGGARAYTRTGKDWTSKYQPIVTAAAALQCQSAIIDGEIYLPDAQGAADFQGLSSAIARRPQDLVFIAFDLLHLDTVDLRAAPLEERRVRLYTLMQSAPAPNLIFSEALAVDGAEAFAAAEKLGLEGIVSKRLGSRYKSGDTGTWLKTKTWVVEDFDIIGFERKEGDASAALLASADGHYAGNALITLPAKDREVFWRFVEDNMVERSPIPGLKRKAIWIKPGLAATVRHLRGERLLRHATLTAVFPKLGS